MSDWRVMIRRSLRQPRPSIDLGLTGSPTPIVNELKAEPQQTSSLTVYHHSADDESRFIALNSTKNDVDLPW
jgi:hypothetical protein